MGKSCLQKRRNICYKRDESSAPSCTSDLEQKQNKPFTAETAPTFSTAQPPQEAEVDPKAALEEEALEEEILKAELNINYSSDEELADQLDTELGEH